MLYYSGPKTPSDFWKSETPPFVRFCVLAGGVSCVFVGLLTLLSLGLIGLLDGLFITVLGYGIWARRSRACAVVASLYYALNQLLLRFIQTSVQVTAGSMIFTYILLGCMILSIYGTFTFQTLYLEYRRKHYSSDNDSQELPPPDSHL